MVAFDYLPKNATKAIYNSRNLMVAFDLGKISSSEWIYNSRNLMVAFDDVKNELVKLSTTVEILWWLSTDMHSDVKNDLQQ